jgi:hypothetical protein
VPCKAALCRTSKNIFLVILPKDRPNNLPKDKAKNTAIFISNFFMVGYLRCLTDGKKGGISPSSQSEIKTVEEGPFQTIFHLDIISRPINIPKLVVSLGFDIAFDRSNLMSLHELIFKFEKDDNSVLGKAISTAKFGMV